MSDLDLDALAAELADFAPPPKAHATYSAREERIIAGFEDIERFFEDKGRLPQHGEDCDIFERLYSVRLARLRELEDCMALLVPFDKHGLLNRSDDLVQPDAADLDPDALFAELSGLAGDDDITQLRHVRSAEEKRAAEDIANREKCQDFEKFKPLFKQVQSDIDAGTRVTRPFVKDSGFLKADVKHGQFFILGGQIAYVAEVGEAIKAPNGELDARLRVVYSNGTESNLLLRSLQRALYKDEAGRRITEPTAGPLFSDKADDGETETGTIYVLRSKSEHPVVTEHREIMHKIGVTSGSVDSRIAGAETSSTYLLAGVEVVATYKVYGVNCQKLENLIHKVFAAAQINLTIPDRFGHQVKPREWFLVPISVINEAVQRIRDRSILEYKYDPKLGQLCKAND
jgi:hypothetical protein